jgi:hypothetical protein
MTINKTRKRRSPTFSNSTEEPGLVISGNIDAVSAVTKEDMKPGKKMKSAEEV